MMGDFLSLYLDLEEGQRADLEAASRAAIAFSEFVREVAGFVDPLTEVRLELVSSSEGSLFINSILRLLGEKNESKAEITLRALFIVALFWIGGKTLDWTSEKVLDAFYENSVGKTLSDEELKQIEEVVKKAIDARIGEKKSQRIFRELIHDPAVRGVGVSQGANHKPHSIVPKNDFPVKGGLRTSEDRSLTRRSRTETKTVVLISPVLIEGRRRWRFRSAEGEFGASIKDDHFLESVLSGQLPIIMKRDVEMTIEVEIIDEFKNGVWEPVGYTVLRIVGVPRQYKLQDSFDFNK